MKYSQNDKYPRAFENDSHYRFLNLFMVRLI
jgi:hypothetical protein